MPVRIPPQVQKLLRRERELATIVYVCGPLSAKGVGARLSAPISNSAVRSMLNRLVQKGILNRTPSGGGTGFLYVPAITAESALRQLSEEHFDGSLLNTAIALIALLKRDQNAAALLAAELAREHHGGRTSTVPVHLAA